MSQHTRETEAAAVAAEELTGLALQERALQSLLGRHLAESPSGGPRERLQRHLDASRDHAATFDRLAGERRESRGTAELAGGLLRSGMVAAGAAASGLGQLATAPLALLRQGGTEERVLENLGVEVGAVANKLVILTALREALTQAGDRDGEREIHRVAEETQASLDDLLRMAPQAMRALVAARAGEGGFGESAAA